MKCKKIPQGPCCPLMCQEKTNKKRYFFKWPSLLVAKFLQGNIWGGENI